MTEAPPLTTAAGAFDIVRATEAENERWHHLARAVGVGVFVPIFVQGRVDPNGGSGVLVRIANCDFVFTAGHVVHDEDRRPVPKGKIAVQFPRKDDLFLPIEPGKHIREVWASWEPDVAVIELDPLGQIYWRSSTPIPLSRIATPKLVGSEERVMVFGVPAERHLEEASGIAPQKDVNVVTIRREIRSSALPVITRVYSNVENEFAPPDGRCFHVGWDHVARLGSEELERVEPLGVSGGPVLALDRGPAQLLGLVRSTHRKKFLMCEPIAPALRQLAGHAEEGVRRDVLSALVRLEASAP